MKTGHKSISLKKGWLILLTAVIVTAGVSVWQAGRFYQRRTNAAIQAYMESHRISQGYRRITNAWAGTLEAGEADVAFLGDSLTAAGEWNALFPELRIKNLGVSGDTIQDVHSRLMLLENLQPQKCFLLIGVNDLWLETWQQETPAKILKAYEELLNGMLKTQQSTQQEIFVQSLLPVREEEIEAAFLKNELIRSINEGIKRLAEERGLIYIDVHSALAGEDGQLKKEYSADGLHLTPLGYEVWSGALRPYVER